MSHQVLDNLRYTKEHEWINLEDTTATIGITDFAQSSLGDIVFLELPEVGQELEKNASFGVVESIKSVSDLYSPVAGAVTDVNQAAIETPDSLNNAPYDSWLIKISITDPIDYDQLMDAESYKNYCQELS